MNREPFWGPNAGPFFLLLGCGLFTYVVVRFVVMPPINALLWG